MWYLCKETLWINNRGVQLFLLEGAEIELPPEEAAFLIALGYLEEPAPEGRKGKVQKPSTPEDGIEKPETR
jgi:hypothetical protein